MVIIRIVIILVIIVIILSLPSLVAKLSFVAVAVRLLVAYLLYNLYERV